MCIAILNLQSILSEDVFKYSFENNNDGIGIAFIENGKIRTFKDMNDYINVYIMYLKARENSDLPIMIHSRIGTSGNKDLKNCHPFLITESLSFCHNGIIDVDEIDKNVSDTVHFVRFLQTLQNPENVLNQFSYEYLFAESIAGSGSKFVFLHNNGNYQIINEQNGEWIDDTWFSNSSYKKSDYIYYGNKKIKKTSSSLLFEDIDTFSYSTKKQSKRIINISKKLKPKIIELEINLSHCYGFGGSLSSCFYEELNDMIDYYGYDVSDSNRYFKTLKNLNDYNFSLYEP